MTDTDTDLPALMSRAAADTRRLIELGLTPDFVARLTGALVGLGKALPTAELPQVRFDLRGASAGQFRIDPRGRCVIRYNPALLERHGEAFLRRTVPHETAHFLAYRLFGRGIRPHGAQWQAIMHAFGADPRRCHDYDVSGLLARRLTYYAYHCGCREHRLSSIRHNKIASGTHYRCVHCNEPLRPGPRPASATGR